MRKSQKTKLKRNGKYIGILLCSVLFCILLCTGCAGFHIKADRNRTGTERHSVKDIKTVPEKAEGKQKKGEWYDTDTFSLHLADGWTADITMRKVTSQGQIPRIAISPSNLLLLPIERQNETDKLAGAHIRIIYDDTPSEQMSMREFLDSYDQEEMEAVMLKNVTCDAFQTNIRGVDYEVITYPQEEGRFYIYVATGVDGEKTGVTWKNKEIKEMLESLVPDNSI